MNSPNFAATPDVQAAVCNTANTSTTGTSGTFATIFTAAANGSRIDFVKIKGIVAVGSTQAADAVRLWIGNAAGTLFALTEVNFAVGSGAVAVGLANAEQIVPLGISLPTGFTLQASTDIGGSTASYHITAFGADF
jgi:fructose-1,6-bisphosphatase/sedoheptulose 1,7-bisphosphatase-like protein